MEVLGAKSTVYFADNGKSTATKGNISAMKFQDFMHRTMLSITKTALFLVVDGIKGDGHLMKKITKFIVGVFLLIVSLPLVLIALTLTRISAQHIPDFRLSCPAADVSENEEKEEFKLLTYNVAGGPEFMCAANGISSPLKRVDALAQRIFKSKADVVCLQEVFDEKFSDKLVKKLKEKYPYIIHRVGKATVFWNLNSGLLIASKTKIEDPEFFKFTNSVGDDGLANKGLLKATVKGIDIYNTHLQAGAHGVVFAGGAKKKKNTNERVLAHTAQLDAIGRKVRTSKNLSIAAGDFNIGPELQDLWKKDSNFLYGYTPALDANTGSGEVGTFIDVKDKKIIPHLLDHIRVINNGVDISMHTIRKYEVDSAVDMDNPISDHLPLTATIQVV